MQVYCDNAATTAIDAEVIKTLLPYLTQFYGNASSSHWAGQSAKEAIRESRKKIADLLGALPEEIFFMSGATEANNLAITTAIKTYQI